MKKRILLLPLILMNAIGSAYAMEGEQKEIVAASSKNDETYSPFLFLSDELKLYIIQNGIVSFDSLKEAWPFIANLSCTCRYLSNFCKDKAVTKWLSQTLSIKEPVSLLYAPANKQIREKRKIGTHAAYMMIQALKHAGVDLDQLVFEGDAQNTALMLETMYGKPEMVQALIQSGANINAQERLGYTALIRAVLSFRIDMVKILLDAGADKSIKINNLDMDVLQLCQSRLRVAHLVDDKKDQQKLNQIFNLLQTYEQPQQLLMPSEEPSNNNMEE